MAALAMILAAGVAVGSGPEKVSGEIEQRLDLRGEWEGTWRDSDGVVWKFKLSRGCFSADRPEALFWDSFATADEGGHRLWGKMGRDTFRGNYRQERDYLVIRFYADCPARCYHLGEGSNLLILRRVKPTK